MRALALCPALVLSLAGACDPAPPEPAPGAPVESAFSRARFAGGGADAGSAEPAVPRSADPAALDEILAAAPKTSPRPAASADTAGPAHPPEAPPPGRVRVLDPSPAPDVSIPALERAARAQLYWPLVQRCRDRDGGLLPPEAVHISFGLDADGYLVANTILATPKQERFTAAARCIERELGAATFRAPAAARGRLHTFDADVPSVD